MTHPASFPVRLRLARAADFEAVFAAGRRSADPLFTVLFRCSGLDHARLGMTVPAKRVRKAVGRNRIRRLVRESFRHSQHALSGLDIVVMVKEAAGRANNQAVNSSLDAHWQRLRRASAGD